MGWTYAEKESATSVWQFFQSEFEGPHTRILDCAVVGLRTAYLAIESIARGEDQRKVFAVVCLLDYRSSDRFGFGYKDMSEEMGPVEDHCPERILDLLSPTGYEYALNWRERCRKRIERRKAQPSLKTGCYLHLHSPLHFADGRARSTFYIADARRRRFISDGGVHCKIPRAELEQTGYEVYQSRPLISTQPG